MGKLPMVSDMIGVAAWKTGMTTSRKSFALMGAKRGFVGVITVIIISLVVTEDTT